MNEEVGKIIKRILRDIQVGLSDEFDRNFERQAFFSEAWARRKSPNRPGGTLLIDTGNLRRSVRSRTTENSITFFTDLPYAAIHNDGGEIVVTAKMKRFFWYKYYEATGSFGRKRTGSVEMINGRDNSPQRPISGVLWPSNEPGQLFAYRAVDSSVRGRRWSASCAKSSRRI